MRILASRSALILAAVAATAMTVSPVLARDHGWGGYHRQHHGGIDGGDFLLGALVVGGIAAVASAADSRRDNRDANYSDGEPDDRPSADNARYDTRPELSEYPEGGAPRDIAYGDARSARDACSAEAGRGDRGVEAVDSVARESDGYRVDGRTRDGQDFTCSIDRDGHIQHFALDAPDHS